MDLSIALSGIRLNIRVAILLKSPAGYVFERDKSGFFCAIGGRIKAAEDSPSAARREVKEEIGIDLDEVRLIGIIENFFDYANEPFHELCFLYKSELSEEPELPVGFCSIPAINFLDYDIKPAILRDFAESDSLEIRHYIVRK